MFQQVSIYDIINQKPTDELKVHLYLNSIDPNGPCAFKTKSLDLVTNEKHLLSRYNSSIICFYKGKYYLCRIKDWQINKSLRNILKNSKCYIVSDKPNGVTSLYSFITSYYNQVPIYVNFDSKRP